MIKGYRELTECELIWINSIKELADQVGKEVESFEHVEGVDQRWLNIAKTDLQKGFMALVRSIAQPTSF
jgi:hypothetical protein